MFGFRSSRLHHASGITEFYFLVRFEAGFRGAHHILDLGFGVRLFAIRYHSRPMHAIEAALRKSDRPATDVRQTRATNAAHNSPAHEADASVALGQCLSNHCTW